MCGDQPQHLLVHLWTKLLGGHGVDLRDPLCDRLWQVGNDFLADGLSLDDDVLQGPLHDGLTG